MTRSAAVGKLVAGLALAGSRPAPVVGVGSSTMEGYLIPNAEDRWWSQFVRLLQQTFPGPTGEARTAPVYSNSAAFTPYTARGVHGYSAGQAGLRSDNYLTTDEIARISALAPVGIVHMVGSNDMVDGISPTAMRKNIESKLDRFNVPSLCGHVYVHQHRRNGTFAYDWSAYRDAWAAIAAERPTQVGVLSVADIFASLGVPGNDPRNLLQGDNTHLEVAGQTVMARLVFDSIMAG